MRQTCWAQRRSDDSGFTLLELLIVTTVLPIIVGALSLGIISVFSLQSNVSNRLTDTADAQVVAANYSKDIQSASEITTDPTASPQCGQGTGTMLLGLLSVPSESQGGFQSIVSYDSVTETSGSTTTYSLVRLTCTGSSYTPVSQTTLAYDLPSPSASVNPLTAPTLSCVLGAAANVCSDTAQQWTTGYVSAQEVATVNLNVTAPNTSYNYDLWSSPAASTSFNGGGQSSTATSTQCNAPSSGTGLYASGICFIDFSGLTGNALTASQNGNCLNMSVAIGTSDIMYFCFGQIVGSGGTAANDYVVPDAIPTISDSPLGNALYSGVGGKPALYMNTVMGTNAGDTITLNFTNISIINTATGLPATGWAIVSADAESTDNQEYITWTSNQKLSVLSDADSGASAPVGNACAGGLTGSGTTSVTCSGYANSTPYTGGTVKTGAALVSATTPSSLIVTMNNFEAVTFGLLLP